MPEKETIKAVPQEPQAVEKHHLPQRPSVQVPEAVDQNADERNLHEVEYDHANDTGDKVRAVLQTRLQCHAYQPEVQRHCIHSASLYSEAGMNTAPGPAREKDENNRPEGLQTQRLERVAAAQSLDINRHRNVIDRLKGQGLGNSPEEIREEPQWHDLTGEE